MMKILLFDINEHLCEAWRKEFSAYDNVDVHHGALETVPEADCIVAAGNSFGIMDGGLDAAMATQFPEAQKNVSDSIASNFVGELPVGRSVIVATGHSTFPLMAYTPTMRFPRPIAAEVVYDSMRAVLLAVREYNTETEIDSIEDDDEPQLIQSIAIPGLGTLSGGVGAFTGARMMRLGYESIYERRAQPYESWPEVEKHLKKLYERLPS